MKILSSPVNIQVNTGEVLKYPKSKKRVLRHYKKEVFADYKKRALTRYWRVFRSTLKREVFADYKKESVYLVFGSFPSL